MRQPQGDKKYQAVNLIGRAHQTTHLDMSGLLGNIVEIEVPLHDLIRDGSAHLQNWSGDVGLFFG